MATVIDIVNASVAVAGVFAAAAWHTESFWTALTVVLGGLCVLVYLVRTWIKVVGDREMLAAQTEAEIQTQKIRVLAQLSRSIAHGVNNALAAIRGHVELSMIETAEDRRDACLQEAIAATDRGRALADHLLVYAREARLRLGAHDLNALTRGLAKQDALNMPQGVRLATRLNTDPVIVRTDARMFETVVLDLVANARNALGPEGGDIRLEVTRGRAELAGQGEAEVGMLHVVDTGPGMSPETLARATEPFFTTRDKSLAVGLGLSVARGFAEQCGGRLRLENLDGGGFRAILIFPLAERS